MSHQNSKLPAGHRATSLVLHRRMCGLSRPPHGPPRAPIPTWEKVQESLSASAAPRRFEHTNSDGVKGFVEVRQRRCVMSRSFCAQQPSHDCIASVLRRYWQGVWGARRLARADEHASQGLRVAPLAPACRVKPQTLHVEEQLMSALPHEDAAWSFARCAVVGNSGRLLHSARG